MNDLIKIDQNQIGQETTQTVNARELWVFLESGQEFSNWIQGRIGKYGFVEGQDFLIILSKSAMGRPSKEFHISIDMAKQLAMVENNYRGSQARQYFIDCEKKYKASASLQPQSPTEILARAVLVANDELKKLSLVVDNQQKQITRMGPKEEFFDAYLDRKGLIELGNAGKIFSTQFPQVGPNKIFPFLVASGVLWEDRAGYHAYQNHIRAGTFFTDDSVFNKDGVCFKKSKTYATSKGMAYIHGLLSKKFGNGQKTLFRISA